MPFNKPWRGDTRAGEASTGLGVSGGCALDAGRAGEWLERLNGSGLSAKRDEAVAPLQRGVGGSGVVGRAGGVD
ncbi:hypothetical protein Q5W_07145 [Hydrogenophaga sp. PBC]|nr:hypothetical protein Q5W_07145 [Hydrogenophaga sp. PBC]